MELSARGLPFAERTELQLRYKGQLLKQTYIPDFICFQAIIVEIKSVSTVLNEHRAQVHNYLKGAGLRLGLLVNFGCHSKLEFERIVR
mgnify:CR=1 FL=1